MVGISYKEYDDVVVISIEGEFFFESVAYLENLWNEQVEKNPKVIAINCKEIRFIDSSAIGILVMFRGKSKKLNVELILYDLSEAVVSIFKITKLEKFFNIMTKKKFENDYLK